jgi:hypothetical protein
MPTVEGSDRIDLLLTPQFYFMKCETIPLRFAFQARKIAPSVLEELTQGNHGNFRHEVLRTEEGWCYFAYEPRQLEEFLREKGVNRSRIGRLYFAQQLEPFLREKPLPLPPTEQKLLSIDGTVTVIPEKFLEEREMSALRREMLSGRGFPFPGEGKSSRIGRKATFWLTLLFSIFGLSWIAEGIHYRQQIGSFHEQLGQAVGEESLLASRITRESIFKKYDAIDRRQRKIRETVRKIGSLVGKESKLERLKVTPKGYEAELDVKQNKIEEVRQAASSLGLSPSVDKPRSKVLLKGSWQ